MAKSITIYTSNSCSSCKMVKKYLEMKGASYSEVNIEINPARQQEMVALSGQNRVPVTIIEKEDGARDMTIGYNLASLASAIS